MAHRASLLFRIAGIACFLSGAATAQAAEPLRFLTPTPAQINVLEPLADKAAQLALADLNEDGIYEFILRIGTDCGMRRKLCDFRVLADSSKGMIELGHIRAHDLALSAQYSHGIRSLLAFANPHDDYAAAVYRWEPDKSRYMIAGQATP